MVRHSVAKNCDRQHSSNALGASVSRCFGALLTFLLIHRGNSLVNVNTNINNDAILPCQLEPPTNAAEMTVEWSRPDLDPPYVHVHRDGLELSVLKNPSYWGRTSLSEEDMKTGDVSLKLSGVTLSDEGRYTCLVMPLKMSFVIQLTVGAVSIPVISFLGKNKDNGGVVVQCESKGWYPEPKMSWLDSDGNVLPAEATETVRDTDGFYTVRRTVTVFQTDTNRFTCRVHQQVSQAMESETHVPDDFFVVNVSMSSYWGGFAVGIGVGALTVLCSAILWKYDGVILKRE